MLVSQWTHSTYGKCPYPIHLLVTPFCCCLLSVSKELIHKNSYIGSLPSFDFLRDKNFRNLGGTFTFCSIFGGTYIWGDQLHFLKWGDLNIWGDLKSLGGPRTPLRTMVHALECCWTWDSFIVTQRNGCFIQRRELSWSQTNPYIELTFLDRRRHGPMKSVWVVNS